MSTGTASDTAEAGPSRPRNQSLIRRFSSSDTDLDDDPAEQQREAEAATLEDLVTIPPPLSSNNQRHSLPSEAFPSLLNRPAPSRHPSRARTSPFSTTLELPTLHTSSSEVFDDPSLGGTSTRPTTYSSLPPSPRGEEYDLPPSTGKRPLESVDIEAVLERLNVGGSLQPGSTAVDEEEGEERYWPARSRRATVGEEEGHQEHLRSYLHRIDGLEHVRHISEEPERATSPDGGEQELEERAGPGVKVSSSGRIEVIGIWDLLKDEMGAEEWEGWIVDGKWERIANFLAVPLAVEKTTLFGALLCLDGFLYNFTVLPIRALFALTRIVTLASKRKTWWPIPIAHQHSILRMLLLLIPTVVLLVSTDASKMYHTVRGQDTIKLYVIFNALEIGDRLCCAFGQDLLDTLFARETLAPTVRKRGKGRKRQQARPAFFFALSLGYVLTHAVIFFYMLVSLNVAINSYDYTLLSLLISNQFVEIKGSVFKKFEKENLFQIMCADIVERFQLSLMLSVIALRNMIEMSGSDIAFLPKSFIRGKSLVDSILSPVLFVIVSEMIVDWLKHAFITKFNHVRASVYERFTDVLAKDVLLAGSPGGSSRARGRNHQVLLDQSPLVARRLGFASIPLACLVIRISAQAIGMLTSSSHHTDENIDITSGGWGTAWVAFKWASWVGVALCAWGCLIFLKVILGLALLSFSAMRQEGMEAREAEDVVNDFGRAPVGESKEETDYNKQTRQYLSHRDDDLPAYSSPGVHLTGSRGGSADRPVGEAHAETPKKGLRRADDTAIDEDKGKKKGKKWKLEEVERWTMVKRIW
ncbi:hypothetical protein IAU60_001076 [Kwoniella sp. DSM 27419]